MKTVNKVDLLGFVVTDILKLSRPCGKNTITFRLKTVNKFKTSTGEYKEEEEFTNIVAFESIADNIEKYVQKGDTVLIEGRLHTRRYLKDGTSTDIVEVVTNSVSFIKVAKFKEEWEGKNTYTPTESLPLFLDLHAIQVEKIKANTAS